jgi:protein-disulfide isomerase
MNTRSPTPKATPAAAARYRVAAQREAGRRRAARRRTTVKAAAVAAVLLLVVGLGILLQSQRGQPTGPAGTPAGTVDGTGFPVGRADAPVTVEIYEDFQCPACRQFEQLTGSTLDQLVGAETVRVVYRPIALLDRASTTRYSTRALNAAGCAADAGVFPAMHDQLFAHQPSEGSAGLPDDLLIKLARQGGAAGDQFARCVTELRYQRWTAHATDTASKKGITGTPTVLIDGHPLTIPTPGNLQAAVQSRPSITTPGCPNGRVCSGMP